jgi:hypothetical protein
LVIAWNLHRSKTPTQHPYISIFSLSHLWMTSRWRKNFAPVQKKIQMKLVTKSQSFFQVHLQKKMDTDTKEALWTNSCHLGHEDGNKSNYLSVWNFFSITCLNVKHKLFKHTKDVASFFITILWLIFVNVFIGGRFLGLKASDVVWITICGIFTFSPTIVVKKRLLTFWILGKFLHLNVDNVDAVLIEQNQSKN